LVRSNRKLERAEACFGSSESAMDYEARRLANIRRNEEALKALDLIPGNDVGKPVAEKPPKGHKRAREEGHNVNEIAEDVAGDVRSQSVSKMRQTLSSTSMVLRRRSPRFLAPEDQELYKKIEDEDDEDLGGPKKRRGPDRRVDVLGHHIVSKKRESAKTKRNHGALRQGKPKKPLQDGRNSLRENVTSALNELSFAPFVRSKVDLERNPDYNPSTRELHAIDVAMSPLEGSSCPEVDARIGLLEDDWLGKLVLPKDGRSPPKQTIMHALGAKRPRFSKYASVQNFRNCLLLFINAGPVRDHHYANVFRRGAGVELELFFSWFSQERQSMETPIIQKLAGGDLPVFLFARLPARHYVCLGKVSVAQVIPHQRLGVQFWWRLEHAKGVLESSGFKEIVQAMDIDIDSLIAPGPIKAEPLEAPKPPVDGSVENSLCKIVKSEC